MVVHCSPLQLMHSSQSDCVVLNSCNVSGNPAVNLADLSLQPEHRQYFKEVPQNLTVVEGESVTLRLVANLDCIRFNVSNIRQCGKRSGAEAEILKYNVNVEPNLGPRLFAALSIEYVN